MRSSPWTHATAAYKVFEPDLLSTVKSLTLDPLGCLGSAFVAAALQHARKVSVLSLDCMRNEIEQAVQLLQRKDVASLEQALTLLQSSVFSFSMRVCGQRQDAEDTMQEVLVKSLPYLPKFENAKALVVWLYKVAKNRCLMNRRRSKFAPKQDLSLEELMPNSKELDRLPGGTVDPERSAMRSEEARHLRQAVQKLPPQYRIVLVLRDMEGLSDDEVAEITGLRSGTVRVRLHRARLFVRKELMKRQVSLATVPHRPALKTHGPLHPRRCKALFAELSDYLDEKLDDSLCQELERHMNGCEPCKAFLSSLESTIQQCRHDAPNKLDPKKSARIRSRLLASYKAALKNRQQPLA